MEISDDDDAGHSSDECEFEDVWRYSVGSDDDDKANDKEVEVIRDERGTDNDVASTDFDTSDNSFSPRSAGDYGTRDECDVADMARLDDASDEDVVGRDSENVEGQADKELNPDSTNKDDEAINFDPNNDTNAPNTADTTMGSVDDREDVIAEISALRKRLTRLEAKINPRTIALPGTSPSGKRIRIASTVSCSKKPKNDHLVNISATRACLQSDDGSDIWVYSWQRGRGGRCWVRDVGAGRRDEVDGESLLSFSSDMYIDVRRNTDWLPSDLRASPLNREATSLAQSLTEDEQIPEASYPQQA
ncbi:hypothetical protein VDGL01_11111 [Verticillium dahliae]